MNNYETTKIINAIEYAWQAIQNNHDDTPDVIVTMGMGTTMRGLKLGHFAKDSWQKGEEVVCELFVGGEGLERGAKGVLGTLLHEASHGIAHVRKLQDTSRQGRYHNGVFKSIAEEVGIDVENVPTIGWSKTTLPAATAGAYAAELVKLEEALVAFRKGPRMVAVGTAGVAETPKRPKRIKITCEGCERNLRVAEDSYNPGDVHCNPCAMDYREV